VASEKKANRIPGSYSPDYDLGS